MIGARDVVEKYFNTNVTHKTFYQNCQAGCALLNKIATRAKARPPYTTHDPLVQIENTRGQETLKSHVAIVFLGNTGKGPSR